MGDPWFLVNFGSDPLIFMRKDIETISNIVNSSAKIEVQHPQFEIPNEAPIVKTCTSVVKLGIQPHTLSAPIKDPACSFCSKNYFLSLCPMVRFFKILLLFTIRVHTKFGKTHLF